jgi:hypothetical protein
MIGAEAVQETEEESRGDQQHWREIVSADRDEPLRRPDAAKSFNRKSEDQKIKSIFVKKNLLDLLTS